ncbi:MAG: dihydropteroate synthase [Prevotella sp.]|nr:dihydropteroate synthase [Prevotella sp.]
MTDKRTYKIIADGTPVRYNHPIVMGIVNVTPDSFYAVSRVQTDYEISARVNKIISEGGTIVDVGACSTRPGGVVASEADEMSRLRFALQIIRNEVHGAVVSVDTFSPKVARMCMEEFGVTIINDVSEGCEEMYELAGKIKSTYILMSCQPDPDATKRLFAERTKMLRKAGCRNVVLDPGYGFGKDIEGNYAHLRRQEEFREFGLPLLAAVSRKRMIWQYLDTDPAGALNGTTVVNVLCLLRGADILRVHDVKEAVEAIKILEACSSVSE